MVDYAVTTLDNPYNPFTQFPEWLTFDLTKGYNTNGHIAAFSDVSPLMEDDDIDAWTDLAIDLFLEFNPFGVHYKFYCTDSDEVIRIANEAYREAMKNT